jgi:hypothetical protein
VTFQITAGQTKPVKLTVPPGGSVQHPTDASDRFWQVSATVASEDQNGPSSTTAVIKLDDPSASVCCRVDQILGALSVGSPASPPALDGAGFAPSIAPSANGGWQAMNLDALVAVQIQGFVVAQQEQTQWCWAALAASVANFYNPNPAITQCSLASWAFAPADCCANGGSLACNQPYSIAAGLAHVGHLNAALPNGMTMPAIELEIDASRPIGVRVAWTGGGGAAHAMAIKGYDNAQGHQMIDISDPTYGESTVAFAGFPGNYQGGGTWTHSYTTH